MLAGSVSLQAASPGTADTGHSNITGYSLAGRFGAGVNPTLARVQVVEPGGLQGVRAESGSGVTFFGKNTAATGLGAAAYFTTSSIGGRAMVVDALSGTGNTVGGLFYNRSTGGGVGVWGRAIGAGTATGVFGETLSATGTGLAASNAASGDRMEAAGPNGSLLTSGKLPRHQYTVGSNAPMVPVAYGLVDSAGAIFMVGSNNWTSVRTGAGAYTVTVTGLVLGGATTCILATDYDAGVAETIVASVGPGTALIKTFDSAGVAADSAFMFEIYSTAAGVDPMKAGPDPSGIAKYGGLEQWIKRDPKGYEAWRQKSVAWQRAQLEGRPIETPIDKPALP